MAERILLALLASGNIFLFIKFLIERYDRKHENPTSDRLDKLERDGLRTQMLLLILLKPQEQTEILKLAETYFDKLDGNWYMTSIFNKWLEENNVASPEWFEKGGPRC